MVEIFLYIGTYLSVSLALGWLITIGFDLFMK
ncbi:hypothetical protein DFO73_101667 [Cytobacillus oceanisediminis]|uniref:Uncharacterized protein n=1 Tax=Cytobacillus oceanisediminis TaxID=665099 RepID=A0A2V3A5W9_9BACI|nr:hypothetical protein DFO73_101667 [Cytobacillus oceanisediminis]